MTTDERLRHQRHLLALAGVGFLALACLLAGLFWWDNSQEQARDDARHADSLARAAQLDALAEALTATRDQVTMLGDEPVAPPAAEVLADPEGVEITPPAPIDRELLESAIHDVLPGEVSSSVASYVAACVAAGDCVGPAGAVGPVGAAGRAPTPGEVTAGVLAVCRSDLDCTVTDDEILQAVVTYCGASSEPCGHHWSEADILRLANHAVIEYTSGRQIWCPAENDVPNDEVFGPCYLSSG